MESLLLQELAMIKERTNATIQPLSKSQLLPDGWSPQEVDTFFNGLNEHQMQVHVWACGARAQHDVIVSICCSRCLVVSMN